MRLRQLPRPPRRHPCRPAAGRAGRRGGPGLTLPPAGSANSRLAPRLAPPVAAALQIPEDPRVADFGDARGLCRRARCSPTGSPTPRDNRACRSSILDKRDARVFVFDAGGAPGRRQPGAAGRRRRRRLGRRHRPAPDRRRCARKSAPRRPAASSPARPQRARAKTWSGSTTTPRSRCTACAPIDPKERRLERLASPTPTTTASPTAASTCRWRSSRGRQARRCGRRRGDRLRAAGDAALREVFAGLATAPSGDRRAERPNDVTNSRPA